MKLSVLKAGVFLLFIISLPDSVADNYPKCRVQVGVKLFRALLAADLDIPEKTNENGNLLLYLLYVDESERAEKSADILHKNRKNANIRHLPIQVEKITLSTLVNQPQLMVPTGIFLTQYLKETDLQVVIHHLIVYSPFEGHVEKGVLGGLTAAAQVRPYLNMNTVRASQVRIKPFFIKVAKLYK